MMNSSTLVIVLALLMDVLILLPVCIGYNHFIIKPNSKLPLFRIRRPKFLFIFIIVFTINGIFRISISLLHNLAIIDADVYSIFQRITIYYGSLLLMCIRIWLLYYDLRSARKQQQKMLTKHLTTVIEVMQNETKYKLPALSMFNQRKFSAFTMNSGQKHAHIYGQYKPLLFISITIATFMTLIDFVVHFAIDPTSRVNIYTLIRIIPS